MKRLAVWLVRFSEKIIVRIIAGFVVAGLIAWCVKNGIPPFAGVGTVFTPVTEPHVDAPVTEPTVAEPHADAPGTEPTVAEPHADAPGREPTVAE